MMIAFWHNDSYKMNGIQFAVIYNKSIEMKGIQIGLFNRSENFMGIQLGLWNINQKRSLPILNWSF